MEGKRKKAKVSILVLLGVLLVCAVFSALLITGVIKVPVVGGQKVDIQTAALIKKASNVSDEMTLRQLLLLDLKLDITVTDDIVASETFLVRGNKTLRGDGTLSIDAAGKFEELYILNVQRQSTLTMDGLTLDGKGMGGGVLVNQRAKLVYDSGEMKNIYKGISTNGEVVVNDIDMYNISAIGVYSSFKSQVYLNGGTYTNAGKNFVSVTTGGEVEVNGGTYKGASGTALTNAGVMVIHDANISDVIGNAIYSSGELTTDYQGDKKDGYIQISNITATAISINSNMDVVLSDIHVNVSGSNSLYVGAIVTGCTVKVDNCIFEKSKANSISSVGDVTIKNTSIIDAGDGGIYLREGGKLKLENILIKNCKGRGIRVLGSTLKAEKVEIVNPGTMGISVNPTKSLPGKATLSEIHISGAKAQNLYMNDETEVYIKDSVLEKSKRTNVAVTDGTLTMENVQVLGNLDKNLYAVQVGTNATFNMKGNTVITGATLRGVQVGTKATFNMLGGSICNIKNESQAAAVWVTRHGTFNMKGGTIYGNYAKKGPGAVTVHGVMNMSGGTIRNNESGAAGGAINIAYDTSKGGTWGTFTMTGGTIKNNIATTSGGGIHVSKDTTANLYGGTITGNKAKTNYNSSGVLNNGKVTIKGSFFMGEDKMYFNRTNVVLNIKGNSLKKHNAKTPLLVVPCESTNLGTTVVKCDNNSAAVSLLKNYVKSGVRSFTLKEQGNVLTVTHNAPDMDMADAETVRVKTFAELRDAIRGTRTKRNIIICADIEMSSAITVPSGTTVSIQDDGVERVIKRKDGNSSAFFTVYYGTGIILKGTTAGNLVVNGEHSENVKEKDLATLITAYGTTVFEDVAFENNEIHGKASQAGAFLYQRAGSFTAIGSSFTNGYTSSSGGAMYLAKGDCYIKDCIFEGNEAAKNAGAISTWENGNVSLTIENTTFKNNKAGSQGGAVNQIAGKLTVIDCTFENNQSTSTGGAIKLNAKAEAVLKGTDEAKAVFKNNAGSSGGAIYLYQAQLSVDGYTFEGNTAKNNGGAIYQDTGASDVTASNTTFKSNTADENGGAICIKGNVLNLENCLFEGNVTRLQGGAIYQLEGTPKVTASNTTFKSNTANGHGGAMYLARGEADIKDSIYEGNQAAKDGGAICTEEAGKVPLTIENTTFKNNKANTGGAVRQSAGTLTVTDCTFETNQSTSTGGSIVLNKNSEAVIKGTDEAKAVFKNNAGSSGGAIYLYQAQLSVDGYTFEGNTAKNNGGAIYQDTGASDVTASNTTFKGNTANSHGGAIAITGNLLNLGNCLFEENNTKSQGGAIYQFGADSKVTASNTTFKKNTSKEGHGGAMYLAKGEGVIQDCIYEGNQAASAKDGGAICTEEAGKVALTIADTTFKDNKAKTGGAVRQSAGTLTVTDCTFETNASTSTGGAIVLNKNCEAVIKGTDKAKAVFKSNTGSSGGAIYLYQAQLSVDGYKFEENTAKNNGGAIYQDAGATNVTAIGCTFENNSSGNNSLYNKTKTLVLTDCTFTNDLVVNAEDSLTTVSGSTTGATFVYTQKAASVAIGSAGFTGNITIKPSDYSTDYVVVSDVDATVKDLIQVTPNGDAQYTLTDDGKLKEVVAEADKVAKIGDTSYDTLSEALAAARLVENTSVDNPVVITVLKDVELTATETITNHVKLTTLADSAVTITRNTAIYMFQVGNADNKGTGSLAIDGKITIDGNQSVDGTGTNLILHYGEALSIGADVIVQNSTSKNGPAIYSQYGKVTLKGTFKGHTYSSISSITKSGGVLRATAGTVYIEGTEDKPVAFTGNQGRYGGAIRIEGATLYVNHAVFNNNTARDYGGAIFINDGSTVHIQNTEFTSNESKSTSISGGAIYIVGRNGSSKLTLEDCQFKDNIAKVAGTAICNDGGTVNISDCSFVNDTYAHRKNSPNTVLSGKITGLTIADLDAHRPVQIGAGSLRPESNVTRRLKTTTLGTVVLSKGTGASDADLARAAELVEIEQTGATATTWLYIAADGKLAQGIEAGAVTVATVDELKNAIAQATDSAIIYIMGDMTISAPIEIGKNITLKSMKPVTLTRDGNVEMFIVGDATNKGVGSLNLGGRITLDANKAKSSSSGKNLILNYGEAVTVGPNVIIKNYKDTNNGAVIRNDVGTITVRGTIADNESTYVAGVRLFGGTLRVEEGAKFTNNVAKYGGAIYGKSATVIVDGAEFNANKASHGGAALYFDSNVTATFTDTDFLSNQHTGTTNGGGAIMQGTTGTNTTMTGCHFEGNTSSKGQSVYNGGAMKLTDCTFVNQTFLNRTKTGKTTISGSIKGVTFVYDYNQASVVIGEGGINSESDITVQLHKDCAVGGAVLGKATNTTAEQLASAAEIIKVAQAEGYTPETWRYVDAEGKLAQGVSTGAVDLLKSIITTLTDAIL